MSNSASRPGLPKRASIAFALVLAATLLTQLSVSVNLAQYLPLALASQDTTQYEERFVEARKLLPRSGVIGYLSDPRENDGSSKRLYDNHSTSAQYQLAPLILSDSAEPQIILGNFFTADGREKAMAAHKLVILHDFGNGVVIFRREGP
jgi:hypothetical protein